MGSLLWFHYRTENGKVGYKNVCFFKDFLRIMQQVFVDLYQYEKIVEKIKENHGIFEKNIHLLVCLFRGTF